MKRHACFIAIAVVALAILRAASTVADPPPMLPLMVGNRWDFVGTSGVQQVETITGTQTVLGRVVFVKAYTLGPDEGLENYWLSGPSGEVLLAGFNRPGFALGYDPPITLCGGEPSVGDTWSTHVTIHDLLDQSVLGEFDVTFSAIEDVSLSVPAGTFHSIGVGQVASPTAPTIASMTGLGLTLDGRQVVATRVTSSSDVTDWYSAGVGTVQYDGSETFQLRGYGSITPAHATSLGALKTLYR